MEERDLTIRWREKERGRAEQEVGCKNQGRIGSEKDGKRVKRKWREKNEKNMEEGGEKTGI